VQAQRLHLLGRVDAAKERSADLLHSVRIVQMPARPAALAGQYRKPLPRAAVEASDLVRRGSLLESGDSREIVGSPPHCVGYGSLQHVGTPPKVHCSDASGCSHALLLLLGRAGNELIQGGEHVCSLINVAASLGPCAAVPRKVSVARIYDGNLPRPPLCLHVP